MTIDLLVRIQAHLERGDVFAPGRSLLLEAKAEIKRLRAAKLTPIEIELLRCAVNEWEQTDAPGSTLAWEAISRLDEVSRRTA